MEFYERCFAPAGVDRTDPRVSPLRAADLAGVAPAIVVTAGFDALRDEGDAYAQRLREAGVATIHRTHDGFVHALRQRARAPRLARGRRRDRRGAARAAQRLSRRAMKLPTIA